MTTNQSIQQNAVLSLQELSLHPLFREVIGDSASVQDALELNLTDDFDESTTLDERQFYVTRVGFALSHALGWAEQLHHGVHFLGEFKHGKKANDAGVRKSHHLLYNVENYLIRMVSLYDRCLQLTNAVFHLCMNDESVNHGAIVSNLHVARTEVPTLLKAVKKTIKQEEQERHKLIHRHSHMDPELRRIELMYMHTKETWGTNRKMPYENLVHVRSLLVKKYTARRKKEFEAINGELAGALGPLFDGLLVEYRRQKGRLQKLV